ncbi:MAG: hypothetical protein Q9163_005678 [Psora crenata]
MSNFYIRVPASSANLGPGFDVIGLALDLWLELQVSISSAKVNGPTEFNCNITCEGIGSEKIVLQPDRNLITRTALYVLRCHGQDTFPVQTKVHIINDIPLGRGLGSSGAAVVAGVMLGDAVGGLALSKDRILDFCLMIERHPDNVAAALFGGLVGAYLRELDSEALTRREIPLSEILPEPAGGINTGLKPPIPPYSIGHHVKFGWSPAIKAIVIVPDYEVSTAKAREVLPDKYLRKDVTFNIQRAALLTYALSQTHPDPLVICEAMRDLIHQPYRQALVPGLDEVLTLTPKSLPGLLGICLSGAGPSILVLATHDYEAIANKVISILDSASPKHTHFDWKILEPAQSGAQIGYGGVSSWGEKALTFINRSIRSRA